MDDVAYPNLLDAATTVWVIAYSMQACLRCTGTPLAPEVGTVSSGRFELVGALWKDQVGYVLELY